jgi:membrane protein DedA with SNARE-associated domain
MPDLVHLSELTGVSVSLLGLLLAYRGTAIFVGTFLLGEIWILTAFFLSGLNFWPFSTTLLFATLGSLSADLFWYFATPIIFRGKLRVWLEQKTHENLPLFIQRHVEHNLFWTLLFIKFAVGIRLLFTMYLSLRRTPFGPYLRYNLIGTVFFIAVLSLAGFLTGRGVYNFFPVFSKLQYAIPLLIVIIVCYKLGERYVLRRINVSNHL